MNDINEAEVSIAINPMDPNNIVIAAHSPDFLLLNTFFSTNGGETWCLRQIGVGDDDLVPEDDPEVHRRNDPSVAFDADGNVYVAYLPWNTSTDEAQVIIAKSINRGDSYDQFRKAHDVWSTLLDKPFVATGVDPSLPNQQNVYVAYTSLNNDVYLATSSDGGLNFTRDLISDLSANNFDSRLYAVPNAGPDGVLHVTWDYWPAASPISILIVDHYDHEQNTWQSDIAADSTDVALWWQGFYSIPASPNRGIGTVPSIAVDGSGGPYHGRVYVAYTVAASGDHNDTNIAVKFSDDGGNNWSMNAVMVNDDSTNTSQFLPWLTVDQETGQVCVVWYDARLDYSVPPLPPPPPPNGNGNGNEHAGVWAGLSVDGGTTWANVQVSDGVSDQSDLICQSGHGSDWLGEYLDYISVAMHDSMGHATWADNSCDDCNLNIYTQKISARLYVKPDAPFTPHDGSSWDRAFLTLQDALNAVSTQSLQLTAQIRVAGSAGGTVYRPDLGLNQAVNEPEETFQLRDNLMILGGYSGSKVPPIGGGVGVIDERDVRTYKTILSGVLDTDNSYHVVTSSGNNAGAVLDGFTIAGGLADGTLSNEDIGAGMLIIGGSPRVRNCVFTGNTANADGGAVHYSDAVGGGNPTLVNCLFTSNSAMGNGGAVHISQGAVSLINCTISGNSASAVGGGLSLSSTTPTVTNCILWGNSDSSGQGESAQISGGVSPVVTFTCIEGCTATYCPANGNIATDPLFLDAGNGNYQLAGCSPGIDAADTNAVPPGITTDLAGLPRFLDDPQTTDTGNGAPPVDMGAYEYPLLCTNALGDMNADTQIDGNDIQAFVDCLIAGDLEASGCFCADMLVDGLLDMNDIPCFTAVLLGDTACVTCGGGGGRSSMEDCNGNGVPDATDIFVGTSLDCNLNGVPDECDISSQGSGDVNGNGVPDECEADCNDNGVPDDKDIAEGTSGDVNSNGVPDECDPDCNANGVPDDWDISQGTSPDCNNNDLPDECEEDCNGNGVPDDCDIDPTDPDGNGLVSTDCNGNNWPDECDLALPPPFGSLDCSNNGVPDECDIADCQGDPACDDCNANGVPDACDISSGISVDADSNGIPDECEGQQAQSGGGSPTPESVTAFYEWCFAQEWGPNGECTCSEQFQCMVNMEQSLGLPLGNPKYLPVSQE